MIDFKYAQDNIYEYKFDYFGYLVIVDQIRILDYFDSKKNNYEKNKFLKQLINKYLNQIKTINMITKNNTLKDNKVSIDDKLHYLYEILPAIGFIMLGLSKKIGIESTIPIH